MSNIFGNLGGNQPASSAGGSSLFGSTAASSAPQSKPSLFSFPPAGQPAVTSGGGLFGSTSTTQPQQTSTSGLFSGLGSSQPQQSGGLFGAAQQTSTQAAGSSLFAGLGQSAQAAQANDQNAANAKAASTLQAAYFDQILERGKKRNTPESGLNALGDLPGLQLGLGDIARKVRNLGQGGPTAARTGDSRAYVSQTFGLKENTDYIDTTF